VVQEVADYMLDLEAYHSHQCMSFFIVLP